MITSDVIRCVCILSGSLSVPDHMITSDVIRCVCILFVSMPCGRRLTTSKCGCDVVVVITPAGQAPQVRSCFKPRAMYLSQFASSG